MNFKYFLESRTKEKEVKANENRDKICKILFKIRKLRTNHHQWIILRIINEMLSHLENYFTKKLQKLPNDDPQIIKIV